LKTKRHVELDEFSLACNFQDEQSIRHWLKQYESDIRGVEYKENVIMHIAIDSLYLDDLKMFLGTLKQANLISPV